MRFRHCDLCCTITNVKPPPANGGLISIKRGARSRGAGLNHPHGKNRRGLLNSTVAERRVTISNTDVAIIGGGAAGIAAGRRLADARVDCLIVEARLRLGGRAWTTGIGTAAALDLGCGWLHSADRNPWHAIAVAQGRAIDKTPPPWRRPSTPTGFPLAEQAAFFDALAHFYQRIDSLSEHAPDVAAATFLAPHGRWNGLISAVGSYVSGADLERVSTRDFQRYEDSGVNWRVIDGYGAVIAAHGEGLPVVFGSPARHIDHSGRRLRVDMADGIRIADYSVAPTAAEPGSITSGRSVGRRSRPISADRWRL